VKLSHHHIHRPDASSQLAAALGVEKVYFVDERLWYLRLTGRCSSAGAARPRAW
jgi:hypothetical protein